MPLLLRETDVRQLLPIGDAVDALAEAFGALAGGEATNLPRQRVGVHGGAMNVMAAALPGLGVMGVKSYTAFATAGARHLFTLYDATDGALLALIEADWLGRIRTGAATGLATRLLARADAGVLGVIGTGGQAWPQVEAICAVRPIREVRVFGRNPARRAAFAADIQKRLPLPATAVDSARAAVDGADIVVTITTATAPVLEGAWLAAGTHVNAAGANRADRREVDAEVIRRAGLVVVDDLEQARAEAGDLRDAASAGLLDWRAVRPLAELVARGHARSPATVTLFRSLGIALEDVAVAARVYRAALAHGAGQRLALAGD